MCVCVCFTTTARETADIYIKHVCYIIRDIKHVVAGLAAHSLSQHAGNPHYQTMGHCNTRDGWAPGQYKNSNMYTSSWSRHDVAGAPHQRQSRPEHRQTRPPQSRPPFHFSHSAASTVSPIPLANIVKYSSSYVSLQLSDDSCPLDFSISDEGSGLLRAVGNVTSTTDVAPAITISRSGAHPNKHTTMPSKSSV